MTDWSAVFLGVIAVSTLTMALIQVGLLVGAARAARKATETFERVETSLRPLLTRGEGLAEDTSRLVARVGHSVERAEQILGAVETQMGRASDVVQAGVRVPAREATAMLAGVQAAVSAVRQRVRKPRRDSNGRPWPAPITSDERPDDLDDNEKSFWGMR